MHTIFMLAVLALILVFTGRGNDFDRGYAAASEGRYEASIDYYTKALRESDLTRENRARALNNRGVRTARLSGDSRHAGGESSIMMLKVLAVTDEVDPRIYSTSLMVEPEDTVIARNRMAVTGAVRETAPPDLTAALQPQERIRIFGVL